MPLSESTMIFQSNYKLHQNSIDRKKVTATNTLSKVESSWTVCGACSKTESHGRLTSLHLLI